MKADARHASLVTSIAAALAAAAVTPPADAQEDEVARLTRTASWASLGLGYVSRDNRRFGQYTGLVDEGAYALADFDYNNRDDGTGAYLRLLGRNLGLDSRELRVEQGRQGNYGVFLEYNQIPRYDPYTINTGLTGINGNSLTINGQGLQDVQLATERKRWTLGVDKLLPAGFDTQVRYRYETKDGGRLFGRGTPGAMEFLAEPIDSTTQQLDALLSYATDRLQLSGGYYGTRYDNHNSQLNIAGGAAALATPPTTAFTPIGLPPGNQAHQAYLTGGYNFTPTTRGNFKVAYARATQDDIFISGPSVSLAPGIGNNLEGRVDTTQAQAGITSRPIPKLSLLANFRYEDRDDKTPVKRYFTGASSTTDGTNEPRSAKTTFGRGEASYQLPLGFRVLGGIDYQEIERNTSAVRIVSYREETRETSYRAEVRRSLSETVNGAVSYVNSDRRGSQFQDTVVICTSGSPLNGLAVRCTPPPANAPIASNLVNPLHLADRDRDKWRALIDWMPLEPLSLQFAYEDARDTYSGRDLGPRKGTAQLYSIDATYSFTDVWQATAWASYNETRAEQSTQVNAPSAANGVGGQFWSAKITNESYGYGLGVRGKPRAAMDFGADLAYYDDRSEYEQSAITGAAINSLPDIVYRHTMFKLFGRYMVTKNWGVRLDYILDRWKIDDWTWQNFTYSDGTRVFEDPSQTVHFIGLSVLYTSW
jgi:MtrB/PioB family decaheme-associated outer membrane protein